MLDSFITVLSFPFIQRALLAGLIIGVTTAFLSVFITLRNMSFYADAISHSALAGIALGIMLGVSPFPAAVVFCVLLAIGTVLVKKHSSVSIDTLMGVLFAAGMALGIVLISKLENIRTDVLTLLFGDILAVSTNDIIISLALATLILTYMLFTSKQLLLTTFSQDFGTIRQIKTNLLDYSFFIIAALTIALSIKILGLLLITGLLVLPAAIAKNLAHSFKQTVFLSLLFSLLSTLIGIIASYYIDIPSGPAIILTATGFFILSMIFRRNR